MNILFISALEGGRYSGPLHSVPKQIDAQALYDNVNWINLTNIDTGTIKCRVKCNIIKVKKFSLEKLPKPFDTPDLVVFEEFFKIENAIIARKLVSKKIPYIIIPRCQMTRLYLNNKKYKKLLARILLFDYFAKHALGVQFLTKHEFEDSKNYYKGKSVILPNGIDVPERAILHKRGIGLKGVFIGRYSIVQKGLDILFEAVQKERKLLIKNNVTFELYGPNERTGSMKSIQELVVKNNISDLVKVNEAVYGEEKQKVLSNSDFFVHTSRFEGLPMSVLEALAYSLPCIVTDGTNIRQEIEKSNSGWGAETSVDGVAKALNKMVGSLESMSSYGENARNLALSYSWDEIAKQTHDVYQKLKDDK